MRSKTDVACKNEVLAKIVAHNIVTCIHESNELGIELPFSRKDAAPAPIFASEGISGTDRGILEQG